MAEILPLGISVRDAWDKILQSMHTAAVVLEQTKDIAVGYTAAREVAVPSTVAVAMAYMYARLQIREYPKPDAFTPHAALVTDSERKALIAAADAIRNQGIRRGVEPALEALEGEPRIAHGDTRMCVVAMALVRSRLLHKQADASIPESNLWKQVNTVLRRERVVVD